MEEMDYYTFRASYKYEFTKCWFCANAIPTPKTGCSWSKLFEPVKGWTAVPVKRLMQKKGTTTTSYHVIECPCFVRDSCAEDEVDEEEPYDVLPV